MNKKKLNIGVFGNLYGLLLYYLIFGVDNDEIIISTTFPKEMTKNSNHIHFTSIPYDEYENATSKFIRVVKRIKVFIFHFYAVMRLRIIIFFKTFNKDVTVYGHGHTDFSFLIYEFNDSYMIEDGLINYADLEEPEFFTRYSKIHNLLGYHIKNNLGRFGTHENIKKIYLTNPDFPEILKDKVELIDFKQLWDLKTDQEKTKILEMFNIKDLLGSIDDNLILLITQCLSEDGIISFEEEISIYKKLVNYQHNKNIVIKTHPRENKNYHEIFPDFKVIDKPFPLEFFKCVDIKIEKIITISSTVALHFIDECEIELYDEKTSSEVVNETIERLNKEIQSHKN